MNDLLTRKFPTR